MKLECVIEVINRTHSALNVRTNRKYLKSTLALCKETNSETEYCIIHFSSSNKCGAKYKVKCLEQVFVKCINQGKATLRFKEPPRDLCIKSEVIQLKGFMTLLHTCLTGNLDRHLPSPSHLSVTATETAPTKLIIKDRSEFPSKGFPRTLKSLYMVGLKLCNFRSDVLKLHKLVVLDLSNNEIEKIPYEFGSMQNLSELYLSNNNLGSKETIDWGWVMGPGLAKSLKLLDLSGNQLKYIPKAMWKLQKLDTLKLDNNKLTKLPSTLGLMKSLRYLTVAKNELELLPYGIVLCGLEYIDISSNMLSTRRNPILRKHKYSKWNSYNVDSLANLSAQAILVYKVYYDSNTLPGSIVEFLDNADICDCGKPVVSYTYSPGSTVDLRDVCESVVFDIAATVNVERYFCSACYQRAISGRCGGLRPVMNRNTNRNTAFVKLTRPLRRIAHMPQN